LRRSTNARIKDGPLSQGIVHGRKAACPLHNWNIQREDGKAVAPDVGCACTFPVKLESPLSFAALAAAFFHKES
jgi:nitrite reductase (NADH) small subunit